MNTNRGRLAAFLLGVVLAFPTFFGASWAREQVVSGYPTFTEGDELWGRKSGTTNTKEDVEVTSGAIHIFSEGGTAATPPTGTSATQVQGTVADAAADTAANPVEIGGSDGTNIQTLSVDSSGRAVMVGAAAHDATPSGNPVLIAGRAASNPGAVANAEVAYLWLTLQGAAITKPQPTAATIDTSFTAQAADFTVEAATANLRIKGWSIRESAAGAAVATVVIRHDADGTCDGTAVVAFVELSANQSLQQDYGPDGEAVPNGLCVDVIAGTVDFAAKLKTEANL